jgi:hypothetical protein
MPDLTTGVLYPDEPDLWLVPPWPIDTCFSEVVGHFLRFHPWGETDTEVLLAYFAAYEAALDTAPPGDNPDSPFYARWAAEVRGSVGRCTALYRAQFEAQREEKAEEPVPAC